MPRQKYGTKYKMERNDNQWLLDRGISNWEKDICLRNRPTKIVIHNLGNTQHITKGIGEDYINALHKEKGWKGQNGRSTGYHFVISRSFGVQKGREWWMSGAHTLGHNFDSIGILVFENSTFKYDKEGFMFYCARTMRMLEDQVKCMMETFNIPHTEIYGHKDLQKKKGDKRNTCPEFDVKTWVKHIGLDQFKPEEA